METSSVGEDIIAEYFDEKSIKYIRQFKVSNLKGDHMPYRSADFYLPKYKVYVEFLGKWDDNNAKEKYRDKKEVYSKNNIPCIYIYPDNLGVFNFIFKRRLRDVFNRHPKLKFQKFLYNLDIIQDEYIIVLMIIGVLFYYIDNMIVRVILAILFLLAFYKAMKSTFFRK